MGQLNLRLDERLLRRFEATAGALGRSLRDAGAEALAAWTERHAKAAHAVLSDEAIDGDRAVEHANRDTPEGAHGEPSNQSAAKR
jgi:hypothetical protein